MPTSLKPETPLLVRGALVSILAAGYAILAHLSTARGGHGTLGALLAIGPVGLLALGFLWHTHRVLGAVAWLLGAALIAGHWSVLKTHFVWLYLMQQAGLYGLLGVYFGRTLAPGRVPLCTQMALQVRGALDPAALRYTRQLTLAWTLLFAMVTLALVVLFYTAPLRDWSAFANFGAPLLLILMFVIENRVRRIALPDMQHAGIVATLRASAAIGFGSRERRP
jgi:uncharacterized membrane protein